MSITTAHSQTYHQITQPTCYFSKGHQQRTIIFWQFAIGIQTQYTRATNIKDLKIKSTNSPPHLSYNFHTEPNAAYIKLHIFAIKLFIPGPQKAASIFWISTLLPPVKGTGSSTCCKGSCGAAVCRYCWVLSKSNEELHALTFIYGLK